MTDKKLSTDVERRLKEWSENPDTGLCAAFTTDGYAYYEELKIFLADELAIARAEERSKLLLELLQVFNDYDVPLTMTAEQVRSILEAYLTKKY